jgi:transposase-like protein
VVAIRWYLRYGLSYRDVEELLIERGVEVDHVTVFERGRADAADMGRRRRGARVAGERWAPVVVDASGTLAGGPFPTVEMLLGVL